MFASAGRGDSVNLWRPICLRRIMARNVTQKNYSLLKATWNCDGEAVAAGVDKKEALLYH